MKQVEEAFRQAQQHHQAGRGEAAAALYRKILAKVPGHPGAHHGSGLLLLARGKTAAALEAKANEARKVARKAALKAKNSKAGRKEKAVRTKRHNALHSGLEDSFKAAHQIILDEIKAGQLNQNDSSEEEEDDQ